MRRLFKGTPDLTPDTCNTLLEALDAVKEELRQDRLPQKSVKHPALYDFVRVFFSRYNLSDANMLSGGCDAVWA